ncbi:hypothetical protein QCA50_007103 [Cerrena zonata]|uniref:Uncharacterized protein n=1 Tax=Cerrena zonata TaxID=2478898 RepID=A0AAW0GCQ5_9APHY
MRLSFSAAGLQKFVKLLTPKSIVLPSVVAQLSVVHSGGDLFSYEYERSRDRWDTPMTMASTINVLTRLLPFVMGRYKFAFHCTRKRG